jgi:hypothetical protein
MNTHRLPRSAALALMVAAIAAPSAAAQQDIRNPDSRTPPEEQGQDFRMPDTRDHVEGRGTYNSPDA